MIAIMQEKAVMSALSGCKEQKMSVIDFLFFTTSFVARFTIAAFSLVSTLLIVRAAETAFSDFYSAIKNFIKE